MTQPRPDRPAFGRAAGNPAARPQRFAPVPADGRTGSLPVLGRIPRLATPAEVPAPQLSAADQSPRPTLQELAERGKRHLVSSSNQQDFPESAQPSLGEKLTSLAHRKHQSLRQWTSTAVIVLLLVVSVYSLIALRQSSSEPTEPQSLVAESAPPLWKSSPIVISADPIDDGEDELKVESAEVAPKLPQLAVTKPAKADDESADDVKTKTPKEPPAEEPKVASRKEAPKARATGVTSLAKSKAAARPTKLPSGSSPYPETSYPVVDLRLIKRQGSQKEMASSPPAVAELPGRIEPYTR